MQECKLVKVPIPVGVKLSVDQLLEDWLFSLMSTLVMGFGPQD
jgi:hypothetical protein